MKHKISYKIIASKKKVGVTFTVPNDVESQVWLHDLIAIRVAAPGQFIADVYNLQPGRPKRRKGEFAPRFKTFAETKAV